MVAVTLGEGMRYLLCYTKSFIYYATFDCLILFPRSLCLRMVLIRMILGRG